MKLLADLHTHSKYSRFFHGKNSIEEMAIAANELGLVEIAITDHGYKHWCRTNFFNLLKAREEIDEINKWSTTKVLLGIEADIISEDGTIDIDEDVLMLVDILIIGYHKFIKTDFVNYFGKQKKTKSAINKATNAYLNAIEKYPVTIISHLDSILKTDLYKIGKACAEKGVMIEINNRHCKWTENQVNDLIASDCMFVVSSDAHCRDDVGNVSRAFRIVKKYNIPLNSIANIQINESFDKNQDDLEIEHYYGLYKAKQQAKEERQRKLEEKKKTYFTNSLSKEMEMRLREIAKEKGLHYEETPDDDDLIDDFNDYRQVLRETEDAIASIKERFEKDTLNKINLENDKIQDDSNILEDDAKLGQELLKDDSDMTHINDGIDEIEKIDSNESLQKTIQVQEQKNDSYNLNVEELSEDEKVLKIMNKTDKAIVKPTVKNVKKGTLVIESNVPKAKSQKKGASNADSINVFMNSVKGVQSEKVESKSEKNNISNAKKGRGGVFIQINEISDNKKDNN